MFKRLPKTSSGATSEGQDPGSQKPSDNEVQKKEKMFFDSGMKPKPKSIIKIKSISSRKRKKDSSVQTDESSDLASFSVSESNPEESQSFRVIEDSVQKPEETSLTNENIDISICFSGEDPPEENHAGLCCSLEDPEEFPSDLSYRSFKKNVGRARGSSVIKPEDTYEKVRHFSPSVKKLKEESANFNRTLKTENRTKRDMETRNSDDIIAKSDLKSNFGFMKNRNEYRESVPKQSVSVKKEPEDFFTFRKKSFPEKVSHRQPSRQSSLIHRDAETQTRSGSLSATEMGSCCSLEEIKNLERSLTRFLSESRVRMLSGKRTREEDKKLVPKTFTQSSGYRKAAFSQESNLRNTVNDFRTTITEPEKRNKLFTHSHETRNSCRCGNGCGTSDKSTCCCKRI